MGFNRRDFLRCIVVSAGTLGVTGLVGCDDNNDHDGTTPDEGLPVGTSYFPQSVASGDPKPESLVLWTRVHDADRLGEDLAAVLQVATDRGFTELVVQVGTTAQAAFDGCLRVKVTGLEPRTTYYYRFLYEGAGTLYRSRTGRGRTAPASDDDVPVRYAVANCQDYIGRYYNAYLPLLQDENDDLDFVVHLGDYIYETTGDPSFQQIGAERAIDFDDQAGAIELGTAPDTYYAAASLGNYRQLHATYRSDPVLQQVHERFPFVCLWDDHEFSNDHWGDTATYLNGLASETDLARKHNAEQAWLEWMPIDDAPDGGVAVTDILNTGADRLYPNTRIFRDLRFGRHVHLILTDTRSYRPDHLIPEDAFPATILLDQPTLEAALGAPTVAAMASQLSPYVDFAGLDATRRGTLLAVFSGLYQQAGLDSSAAAIQAATVLSGDLDVNYLNLVLQAAGETTALIDPTGLPAGLSYLLLGKQDLYSSLGSRSLAVQASFDLFAQLLAGSHDERLLGDATVGQEAWFLDRVTASTATWKVVGHSISNTSLVLDLTQDPAALGLPAEAQTALGIIQGTPGLDVFANRFYLNVEHWDGFPNKRKALLDQLRTVPNTVIIAGDIHAGFVTDHSVGANTLYEFTANSISSTPFAEEVDKAVSGISGLNAVPGIDVLVANLGALLDPHVSSTLVEQQLVFQDVNRNGVVVMSAGADELRARYYLLPAEAVATSYYDDPQGALAQLTLREYRLGADGVLSAV